MSETPSPVPAPSEPPSTFWSRHRSRVALGLLTAYVATLGVFTVNDILRLDLFEWEVFTPELHSWVYDLLGELADEPEAETEADLRAIERRLARLKKTLARTRYARVPAPGSLEERLTQFLAAGVPGSLSVARERARDFIAEGQVEARARLADIEDWVVIPLLVKYLDHDSEKLRREAFAILRKVAETFWSVPGRDGWRENGFGYDPSAPRVARLDAIRRWKAWVRTLDWM